MAHIQKIKDFARIANLKINNGYVYETHCTYESIVDDFCICDYIIAFNDDAIWSNYGLLKTNEHFASFTYNYIHYRHLIGDKLQMELYVQ